MASAAVLVVLVGAGLYLATPRTKGVDGEWSARAVEGTVVAGRAVLSSGNTALDLQTGKTVTLGSVTGGTPFVADDRLIIASAGRIDSARLDATARWTWRSPAGTVATPLAAAGGSTIVLVCSATGPCRLVGLNAQGRQDWQSADTERREPQRSDGALPRVDASGVPGGGVVVTDPVSGRSALQPGRSFLSVGDGPVVTELLQDDHCVVSAYAAADALWTRVLDTCPAPARPTLAAAHGSVTLTWPTRSESLDLATGRTLPAVNVGGGAAATGRVLARAPGTTATQTRETLHTNPFRWGARVTVITLRDSATGEARARVVSDQHLTLLRLDQGSVVVRDSGRVIRYALDSPH